MSGLRGTTGSGRARATRALPARARAGFTLLEVVLALGLLLLGVSAVLGLLSFGAALARTADLRTAAAQTVEAVVADLEESLFPLEADGTAGEPVPVEGRTLPDHPGLVYSAVAVPNPEGPHRAGVPLEYRVDVEIAWQAGGRRRARRFTTLLLREVPFGERIRRAFVEYDDAPAPRTPNGSASASSNEEGSAEKRSNEAAAGAAPGTEAER